ncbi:MAG: two-component sensor histidine kinase [Paludibacteraceae bacterium]|nr:two-component sensor histidine kinase [Paludibacteraceae bacterium]MBN2787677.1 two-component sensor histidine kinase [Paludibacteraceae bacterium]
MKRITHKIRFDQRLFLYIFFIFFLFSLIVSIFQYQREKQFRVESLEIQLSNYNTFLNNYLSSNTFTNSNIDSLVALFPNPQTRVTILNNDGSVFYDSYVAHNKQLENHLSRPEIQQALKNDFGSAIRHSSSTGEDFFYVAKKYSHYFIRSALPYNMTLNEMLKANPKFFYFMLIMFLITVVSLIQISNRIGKSISQLRDFAQNAENDNEMDREHNFTNDELGEISAYIVEIYKRLRGTKNDLYKEREKLFKHLQITQEGLAIFSADKKEILSNSHFLQFFDVISDIPLTSSNEVFAIPEISPIKEFITTNLLDENKDSNLHSESIKVEKNGHSFMVRCIVFQDNNFEISINNITQQERENQLKRQLTQNISHELKTPVSSIQGYMETIIANPDLDPEKLRFFIDRSYYQSVRLTQLLQDISLLNKIDEATNLFEREMVYVNEIICDVLNDVSLEITKKNIAIETNLEQIILLRGNRSLLYSVFRNLVDNSITYAGENLTIGIQCYREDESFFYFRYYDTGVGVSEEHLSRLFERFYRIDQGRSRKMGGTGLGLAIVKNAILFHQGTIIARNRMEGGLEFLFTLKKENDIDN